MYIKCRIKVLLILFNLYSGVIANIRGNENKGAEKACKDCTHPLDPLTELEIAATSYVVGLFEDVEKHPDRPNHHSDIQFNYIALKEPPKSLLLPFFLANRNPSSSAIPRRSFAVVLDRATNQFYEFTVNLNTRQVERRRKAPKGVTAFWTPEDSPPTWAIAKASTAVQERCAQLGYPNMSLVQCDSWSMGYIGDRPEYQDKRLAQLWMYGQNFYDDNYFAHPMDFVVIVDLLKEEVVAIEELPSHNNNDASNKEGNVVNKKSANYAPELLDPSSFRNDLKPVKVSQEGTSFTITGNELEWQKYKMRFGVNAREGLVLYMVNYNDGGNVRPLFYRMSLGEMFVPYGDPRPPYHRKSAFDEGGYGIGFCLNSLIPGSDCVGEARLIDAVIHDDKGQPKIIPNAICIREEDAGILWRHMNDRTGKSYVVRSQRLAITVVATVGNYDYIFTWNFYQDASIEFNVQLSGILHTTMLAVNATPTDHASVVMPGVNGQYHQHFISLRLDAEIDGNSNRVTVSDIVAGPGETGSELNPYGQAFTTDKKLLKTAGESRTNINTDKSRTWIITNSDKKNSNTNGPTGWKLLPCASAPLLLHRDSPIYPEAAWLEYNTWVTPYKEDQFFTGGFYLDQWKNPSGLPEWVKEDENASIVDRDVVIWHNFGFSHVPRVEDFPVMPTEGFSVFLKPYNFFLENPALDVRSPSTRTKW